MPSIGSLRRSHASGVRGEAELRYFRGTGGQENIAPTVVKCATATSPLALSAGARATIRQLGEVHRHRRVSADLVAYRCDATICPESRNKWKFAAWA